MGPLLRRRLDPVMAGQLEIRCAGPRTRCAPGLEVQALGELGVDPTHLRPTTGV